MRLDVSGGHAIDDGITSRVHVQCVARHLRAERNTSGTGKDIGKEYNGEGSKQLHRHQAYQQCHDEKDADNENDVGCYGEVGI
jgi:hypothetical protein